MLTDLDCANLVQKQYDNVVGSGVFDYDFVTEGDRASIKHYGDCAVLVDEGSHDFLNWFFNFQAAMKHIRLGNDTIGVEFGFDINMQESVAQTAPLVSKDQPLYCIGHSRGAGRCLNRAARMIALGYDVHVTAFGAPRPGDELLATLLKKAKQLNLYCNGKDPVCTVPKYMPPLLKYVEPATFIMLNEPPAENDEWGIDFGWHHLEPNYINGVAKYQKELNNARTTQSAS